MTIDKTKNYSAILHTTVGDITVSLNASDTPITVNNFVTLAKKKFYNNTTFHRVIKGFMIQGGDPKGDGTGDPGYKFDDEPFSGSYTRGTIAMANSGPNTNGSQFFITVANDEFLNQGHYSIFGQVTSGQDVANAISQVPRDSNDRPNVPVMIKHITIK